MVSTQHNTFFQKNACVCFIVWYRGVAMNKKNKGNRKNVALIGTAHARLETISKHTGITMTKLVDMAVLKLLQDPPNVVSASEIKVK